MSHHRLKWAAVILAVAVVVTACSNNKTSTTGTNSTLPGSQGGAGLFPEKTVNKPVHDGTPRSGGTMTYGMESDVLNTSPNQQLVQPADVQMAYAVFDPLITFGDPDDKEWNGKPVEDNSNHRYNQLADKIDSKDLKTWTLTLRSGVKFSNGKDLTAQEVVDHTMWIKDDTSGKCPCATDAEN
ncbi:MAG: hypothetical protein JST73_05070, partial [Actinobacteria bacterium]|nr:hypothetical protein [Actinomycetota bacterium]